MSRVRAARPAAGGRACPASPAAPPRVLPAAAALAAALSLGACATAGAPAADRDPLEPMNRAVYTFNDALDRAVLKPVAQGYQDYVPEVLRNAAGNVFGNLADLWTAANQLLQGKPREAISDLSRVLINSTVGFAGLGDPASDMGFEKHREDFGQTLGRWGVPAGPYLVLPFFGPSSLRDAPGLGVDLYVGDPLLAIDSHGRRNNLYALRIVDGRAALLRGERVIEGAALDRYSFLRDAYLQRRRNQVYDGNPPPDPEDDPGPTPDDRPTN
ncbi:MAG: VacJ family lipoprotein [Burkholderiales bacterium]|nr:VacJ family lipoprotein [Burkholderiales bacterium]